MNIVVSILIAAVCFCLAFVTLDQKKVHQLRLLRPQGEEELPEHQLSKRRIAVFASLIAVLSAAACWFAIEKCPQPLNVVKILLGLVCLVGSGCVDFLEYRIPNIFPLMMAVGAIVLLAVGYLVFPDVAGFYVKSSVFSAAVSAIVLVVLSILTRQGIGAGDIKLIAAMGLLGGMQLLCGTLFFTMICSALASAVLLISKKKTLKQSIPFGPFVALGYIFTIFFVNF